MGIFLSAMTRFLCQRLLWPHNSQRDIAPWRQCTLPTKASRQPHRSNNWQKAMIGWEMEVNGHGNTSEKKSSKEMEHGYIIRLGEGEGWVCMVGCPQPVPSSHACKTYLILNGIFPRGSIIINSAFHQGCLALFKPRLHVCVETRGNGNIQ